MITVISWRFLAVQYEKELNGYTNVITRIRHGYRGTDGTYTAMIVGSTALPPPKDIFIPFIDLKHQDLEKWIEQVTPPENIVAGRNSIERQIQSQQEYAHSNWVSLPFTYIDL